MPATDPNLAVVQQLPKKRGSGHVTYRELLGLGAGLVVALCVAGSWMLAEAKASGKAEAAIATEKAEAAKTKAAEVDAGVRAEMGAMEIRLTSQLQEQKQQLNRLINHLIENPTKTAGGRRRER